MSRTSFLKSAYLAFLSKPAHHRNVYRTIGRVKARSLVELGVASGERAARMIAAAGRYHDLNQVRYTGIDLFEARTARESGLALKDAHRMLRATRAEIRLIPGDPLSALARTANSLLGTDVLVIGADQDRHSLEQAWFYVPRMLHQNSLVLVEEVAADGSQVIRTLTEPDVERLAARTASTRRAA